MPNIISIITGLNKKLLNTENSDYAPTNICYNRNKLPVHLAACEDQKLERHKKLWQA